MAIASDDSTQPCRALSDCPRAVQRANSMHDEYAAYGATASVRCLPIALLARLLIALLDPIMSTITKASLHTAVQVAILSAQKHAPNLLPVLLYPGTRPNRLTEWFASHGGLVFQHKSVLLPRWKVRSAAFRLALTASSIESCWARPAGTHAQAPNAGLTRTPVR